VRWERTLDPYKKEKKNFKLKEPKRREVSVESLLKAGRVVGVFLKERRNNGARGSRTSARGRKAGGG